jgi:hypothetical protein
MLGGMRGTATNRANVVLGRANSFLIVFKSVAVSRSDQAENSSGKACR